MYMSHASRILTRVLPFLFRSFIIIFILITSRNEVNFLIVESSLSFFASVRVDNRSSSLKIV